MEKHVAECLEIRRLGNWSKSHFEIGDFQTIWNNYIESNKGERRGGEFPSRRMVNWSTTFPERQNLLNRNRIARLFRRECA